MKHRQATSFFRCLVLLAASLVVNLAHGQAARSLRSTKLPASLRDTVLPRAAHTTPVQPTSVLAPLGSVGEPVETVAVHGGYAYLDMGGGALQIIDVREPGQAIPVRKFVAAPAERLQFADTHAYGVHDTSFAILDMSDPISPTVRSHYTPNPAAYMGDHAKPGATPLVGPILASVSPGAKYAPSQGGIMRPPDPRAAAGACPR